MLVVLFLFHFFVLFFSAFWGGAIYLGVVGFFFRSREDKEVCINLSNQEGCHGLFYMYIYVYIIYIHIFLNSVTLDCRLVWILQWRWKWTAFGSLSCQENGNKFSVSFQPHGRGMDFRRGRCANPWNNNFIFCLHSHQTHLDGLQNGAWRISLGFLFFPLFNWTEGGGKAPTKILLWPKTSIFHAM